MTITRVGSNEKYASGWEQAFGKGKPKRAKAVAGTNQTAGAKKSAKKPTGSAAKSAPASKAKVAVQSKKAAAKKSSAKKSTAKKASK